MNFSTSSTIKKGNSNALCFPFLFPVFCHSRPYPPNLPRQNVLPAAANRCSPRDYTNPNHLKIQRSCDFPWFSWSVLKWDWCQSKLHGRLLLEILTEILTPRWSSLVKYCLALDSSAQDGTLVVQTNPGRLHCRECRSCRRSSEEIWPRDKQRSGVFLQWNFSLANMMFFWQTFVFVAPQKKP